MLCEITDQNVSNLQVRNRLYRKKPEQIKFEQLRNVCVKPKVME